ncbi:MAG TPA: hypothetical protein VFF08_10705 [Trueperaceae bacterium]|nr:hypothetical protein [Trueperaceae bacterium]
MKKAQVLLLGVILAASSITTAHVGATYDRGTSGGSAAGFSSSYPWSLTDPRASVAVSESELFPGYPQPSHAARAATDARLQRVGLAAPPERVVLFGRQGLSQYLAP